MIRTRIGAGLFHCLATIPACLVLAGCASPVAGTAAVQRPGADTMGLACTLPTNCVSSIGGGRFNAIQFNGPEAEAFAALRATLAEYPEARITDTGPSTLVAIFRTPAGFEDEVVFKVDEAGKQIDYRSRSLAGLFDFGKNGTRMDSFLQRIQKRIAR